MKRNLIIFFVLLLLVVSTAGCSNGTESASAVDVDLTGMSQTMVEAQFEHIMANSEDFLGKTIRVIGTYFPMYVAELNAMYHYVIIVYGDECCQLGFEFKRDGDYVVPDDYPAMTELIEVIGVLNRYEEWGVSYLYIAVEELIMLND